MKKLLLLVGLLFYSFNLLADIGDVYYCEEKFKRGAELNWAEMEFEEHDYTSTLKRFTFKRDKDFLIFNKKKEDVYNNLILMVDQNKNSKDIFWAYSESGTGMYFLRYDNSVGRNFFVMTVNLGTKALFVFANCEIF